MGQSLVWVRLPQRTSVSCLLRWWEWGKRTRLAAFQVPDPGATDAHGGLQLPKAHHPGNCSGAGMLILGF